MLTRILLRKATIRILSAKLISSFIGRSSNDRQAAFCPRQTLAHLARWAEADMVRFFRIATVPFTFAQRAF